MAISKEELFQEFFFFFFFLGGIDTFFNLKIRMTLETFTQVNIRTR